MKNLIWSYFASEWMIVVAHLLKSSKVKSEQVNAIVTVVPLVSMIFLSTLDCVDCEYSEALNPRCRPIMIRSTRTLSRLSSCLVVERVDCKFSS